GCAFPLDRHMSLTQIGPGMQGYPKGIVLLTGTLGSGKTTVAIEVARVAEGRGVPCAAIDLDWLCWVHPRVPITDSQRDNLILQNLLSLWFNFHGVGVEYLVLARALLDDTLLAALERVFPQTRVTVLRIDASPQTIERRLTRRDTGEILEEHLRQSAAITIAVEKAALEDAIVLNDCERVSDVAQQVLDVLAWK
ncbi:MAG: hypothetical protein ACREC3_16370, partial [Methyloceanibacter sp.]